MFLCLSVPNYTDIWHQKKGFDNYSVQTATYSTSQIRILFHRQWASSQANMAGYQDVNTLYCHRGYYLSNITQEGNVAIIQQLPTK